MELCLGTNYGVVMFRPLHSMCNNLNEKVTKDNFRVTHSFFLSKISMCYMQLQKSTLSFPRPFPSFFWLCSDMWLPGWRGWGLVTEPCVRSLPAQIIWQPSVPRRPNTDMLILHHADTTGALFPGHKSTDAATKLPDKRLLTIAFLLIHPNNIS